MNIDDLVEKYIAYRDLLAKRASDREAEDKPYVEAMQLIEGACAIQLKDLDVQSIKTAHGTVYQTNTLSCRVADREAFMDYVRTADAFHLLTTNVAKDALKEHMEEKQGQPPPGVDVTYITKTLFRRA